VTQAAQDWNTNGPSSSYGAEAVTDLDKRTEEVELLWKLDRKAEALSVIEELSSAGAQNARLDEVAAFIYLEKGNVSKAKERLSRLEKAGVSTESIDLLRGGIYTAEEKWSEAKPVYQKLYSKPNRSDELAATYAYVLAQTNDWKESRDIYRTLLKGKNARKDWRQDYRYVIQEGAPKIESIFQYLHRPAGQRDYRFGQKGSYWVNPWLWLSAGMGEEVYRRGDFAGADAIKRLLMSHTLEAKLCYGRLASLAMGWRTSYDKTDFQELFWRAKADTKRLRSEIKFDWNQLARDPIEGIAREGRIHRLEFANELRLHERFQVGDTFRLEWYRLPGRNNFVDGTGDLGWDHMNDVYANCVLLRKPYLSMNYHYRQSYWKQKFEGADTVLGFLPAEMAHYGGFYTEYPVGKWMEFAGSVTRGNDHKRNANYLYWYFETRVWIRDGMRVSFGYEYDKGDSGTAGPGDTQIMTTKGEIFF